MTKLIAALLILTGIGGVIWSLTVEVVTGEQAAILAGVAFVFAAALGIWQIADQVEDWLKKQ